VRILETEALILRSVDFGESDRVLHLLVPEVGRIAAIAKGARRSVKRFGGTLDLFNRLRVQIALKRPGLMSRLDRARLIHSYAALRIDSIRFAMGCYLLELLDRVAPEGGTERDMRRLFAFALSALSMLSERTPDERLRIVLELRALDAAGLRPELRRCVRCGREPRPSGAPLAFHVPEGGPVCERCEGDRTGTLLVHLGTLRALDQALHLELDRLDRLVLSPQALEQARHLVGRFQRFHVGVDLRSEPFLDAFLQPAAR